MDRAVKGDVEVVACLANPCSPYVMDRLAEEETSDSRPPIGPRGIERNIRYMLDRLDKAGNPGKFDVRLFEHYLTFATYMIDDDIFVVPYMYRTLGWHAPVFHLRNDSSDVVRSMVENVELMLRDAIPARDIFDSKRAERRQSGDSSQVCVAIIPDEGQRPFRFGTSILGIDLRRSATVKRSVSAIPDLERSIGAARERGFHAPLVGPIHVPNDAAIRRLVAELTVITGDLPRFQLTEFRLEDRWHISGDIVLGCRDHSGVLEVLHSELVPRVCRRALPSGKQLGSDRTVARPGRSATRKQPDDATIWVIRRTKAVRCPLHHLL